MEGKERKICTRVYGVVAMDTECYGKQLHSCIHIALRQRCLYKTPHLLLFLENPRNHTMAAATSSLQASAGRQLLLELQRNDKKNSNSLPPYNLPLVRQCLTDLHSSFEQLSDQVQASGNDEKVSMAARPSLLWHHACIQRHKRCLLTYHQHRLLYGLQDQSILQPNLELNNASEMEFAQSYRELRQAYVDAALNNQETEIVPTLAALHPNQPPPSTASLQVRCTRTIGPVVLSSGRTLNLKQGSLLSFSPTEAVEADLQDFLQDGTLQVVLGEEVDY